MHVESSESVHVAVTGERNRVSVARGALHVVHTRRQLRHRTLPAVPNAGRHRVALIGKQYRMVVARPRHGLGPPKASARPSLESRTVCSRHPGFPAEHPDLEPGK